MTKTQASPPHANGDIRWSTAHLSTIQLHLTSAGVQKMRNMPAQGSKVDRGGRIPLHYAALENNSTTLRAELAAGADVNATDNQDFTPLHFACQQGAIDAARVLLDAGAHVDPVNSFGNTPLMVTVRNAEGTPALMRLLLEHGADPHDVNNYDKTPVGITRIMANTSKADVFADLPTE